MKRFISIISVLVCLSIVLSVAPSAFAAGNDLALGNNVLTLGVVHSYTVEADGVLQLQFHDVYYGRNGGVYEHNLHRWLDFLVNGVAVDKFLNELEVSAGDKVTVQMVSVDGDTSYVAQLYLSFTPADDSGEDDGVSKMTVSDAAALRGEEVVLTVSLANNPGFTNGKITVDYDAAGLEFVDFNFDETPQEVMTMANPEKAMMNFAAALDYAEDGLFFAIVLRVKDDAADGNYAVGLTIDKLENDAEENLTFEVVAGNVSVHVCDPVPVAEVPATTTSPGVKAHSKCACGKLYIDGVEVTEEDLVIPMLGQLIVSSVAGAHQGEEVVLTVSLVNNHGFTNGKITVNYDAAGLEFVGFNFDETPEEILTMSNPGKAMMNFAAALDYAEDGLFFAIVLRVKDDAAEGNYAVGLTINQMKNDAGENVGFEVAAGNVFVHVCDLVPVEEIPATTTSPGVKAHYKCACGKLYIDGVEVTEEDLIIPMLGQMIVSSVEEAQQGEEIVLTVTLLNNPGFTNGKITVDYDAAGLEFVGFNFDETPEEFLTMSNPGKAMMNFATAADYAEDVVFFSIVLRVKDDAADGSYAVSLTINKLENNAEENVGFVAVAGTVTLHTCTAGEPVYENVVEATCTTDGSYDEVVYCSVCGEELSRETVVVEALGHTEAEAVKENIVEATCTTDGSYDEVVYCSVCGEEVSRKTVVIEALGHTEGEVVKENIVEATCTTDGGYDEVVYCSVCGEELSREHVVVEATGHEMGEWYVYRASTGTVKGEKRSDCAHCDYYESELLPYLGDVNGDDKVDTTDAKLVMQYDLALIGEEDLDLSVGDVNGDGKVDTTDAKLIMQLDLKLIEDFPGTGG